MQIVIGIVGVRDNHKFREPTTNEFELYNKILKELPSKKNMKLEFLRKSEKKYAGETFLSYNGKLTIDNLTMSLYVSFYGNYELNKELCEILNLADGIKIVDMRDHPLNNAVDYKISLTKTKASYNIDIYPSLP